MPKTLSRPRSPLRRRTVLLGTDGGIANATVKSLTRDDGTRHHFHVCLESGAVRCDCEHFIYRLARHEPTLGEPNLWCKHLQRHINLLMRRGEISDHWLMAWLRPCIGCGAVNAENAIAPDGFHVTGYVCDHCETAWKRETAAGTPGGLCACGRPESICEVMKSCG